MRLDELEFRDLNEDMFIDLAEPGRDISVYRFRSQQPTVYSVFAPEGYWSNVDALTAQAVLFELCSRSDP